MKKLFAKIKTTVVDFLRWVWSECKDWHTLVLLAIVCLTLSLPIWLGYALGFIFGWEWAFWISTVIWGFWMLPGAPFFALSVSITLGIKRIFEKRNERKQKKDADAQSHISEENSNDNNSEEK